MTFEHLENLPKIVKKCHQLLKDDGVLQIAIPCEGELAFKLGWSLTTAISFRLKYGLDYSKIMSHEHLNTQEEIIIVIKNFLKLKNLLEVHLYYLLKIYHSIVLLNVRNYNFFNLNITFKSSKTIMKFLKDISLIDDLSTILYLTGKAQNDLLRDL